MVLEIDGDTGTNLPEPVRWLVRLQAAWEDQRAGAILPSADELILSDLAELVPRLILACRDAATDRFRIAFAGAAARTLLAPDPRGELPAPGPERRSVVWGKGVTGRLDIGAPR